MAAALVILLAMESDGQQQIWRDREVCCEMIQQLQHQRSDTKRLEEALEGWKSEASPSERSNSSHFDSVNPTDFLDGDGSETVRQTTTDHDS